MSGGSGSIAGASLGESPEDSEAISERVNIAIWAVEVHVRKSCSDMFRLSILDNAPDKLRNKTHHVLLRIGRFHVEWTRTSCKEIDKKFYW